MRKYITYDEIENLSEVLIKHFMKKTNRKSGFCVDIELFATEFLGLPIQYETFSEEDGGRIGFFADGVKKMTVIRNGAREEVVFPLHTVVIEKALLLPAENSRRRFTIAHEAAHMILQKHFPVKTQAAFHSEFDSLAPYTPEMMESALNMNEMFSNRTAACLLMPRFLMKKALDTFNNGKNIVVYEGNLLSRESKLKMRTIAEAMGVSFMALFNRLRELNLLEGRPGDEYASEYCGIGGRNEQKTV